MKSDIQNSKMSRKPPWLKVRPPLGPNYLKIKSILAQNGLFTVCEEASCPNIGECWSGGTATFMLLGGVCTRGCRFCNVATGNPNGFVDHDEPLKIAKSISQMDLNYIVLTSVDRDDLDDHGAGHFAKAVNLVKEYSPNILVETLTPDWAGLDGSINTMLTSRVDVLAHNVETVERLQSEVRDHRASYRLSLTVLEKYKNNTLKLGKKLLTKTSIMLGLGEKDSEIMECMQDLLDVGVDVLTLGQYLQPTPKHLAVRSFVTPEKFSYWAEWGEKMGFKYVASGPLVRSSYRAGEYYIEKILRGEGSQGELLKSGEVS